MSKIINHQFFFKRNCKVHSAKSVNEKESSFLLYFPILALSLSLSLSNQSDIARIGSSFLLLSFGSPFFLLSISFAFKFPQASLGLDN